MCHHYDAEKNGSIMLTTNKASYNIKIVVQSLSPTQRKYLLFSHSFSGCDTVSAVFGFSKEKLYGKFSNAGLDDILDVFYDENSAVDEITSAGISMFQFIYNGIGIPLSEQRLNRFNQQSKVGVLRPEGLPPTDGAAAQHSLRTYLQLHDWTNCRACRGTQRLWLVYHEQWEV